MQSHVKFAAIMHILFGAFGFLTGLLILFAFGSAIFFVSWGVDDPDTAVAMPILIILGSIFAMFIFLSSIPAIITGIGLLNYQNWARILAILISILYIPFHFPLGTILGVYTLWVLFSPETTALFDRKGMEVPPPAPPPSFQ